MFTKESTKRLSRYGSEIILITTPPAPSTCNLTFTVPFAYPNPYVLNVMTGTQVPLSIYSRTSNGNQLTVSGLPISDQPLIIVMQ